MKILKNGKVKKWWEGKVGECVCCMAVVVLEAGDSVTELRDTNQGHAKFSCPKCTNDIWVYLASPTEQSVMLRGE